MAEASGRPGKPLVERWKPLTLDDIVGQWEAVKALRAFGHTWATGLDLPRTRVAVLEGPPGSGKTAAAYALANDLGWGLVEMSASDARNSEAMAEVAGRASLSNSFTDDGRYLSASSGGRTLVLIDEVDSLPTGAASRRRGASKPERQTFRDFLTGRYRDVKELNRAWGLAGKQAYDSFDEFPKEPSAAGLARLPKSARMDVEDWSNPRKKKASVTDEGAPDALAELLGKTKQPILLTANDAYPLFRAGMIPRDGVSRVKFYPVDEPSMMTLLQRVAGAEHMSVTRDSIKFVAGRSHGDARAALNDLEVLSVLEPGRDVIEVLGTREVESNLFEATRQFLSAGRFYPSVEVMATVDCTPEDLLPWIEENLPAYAPTVEGLRDGFEVLARAELHLARANRWRAWALWSYVSELLAGGVSVAMRRGGPPPDRYHTPRIEFPSLFMGMKAGRENRWVREALARKIGEYAHMSIRRTSSELLPVVSRMLREPPGGDDERMLKSREFQRGFAQNLGLGPSEIAFLMERPRDAPPFARTAKGQNPAQGA